MSACVIDSSAVMAFLNREPGEPVVSDWLDRGATASALILQEVMSNLVRLGLEREAALEAVAGLGLKIHNLTEPLALEAGAMTLIAKPFGLSHGDRACLALARQLGLPAVTVKAQDCWKRRLGRTLPELKQESGLDSRSRLGGRRGDSESRGRPYPVKSAGEP